MKKIIQHIKSFFSVQYRLTVIYAYGGEWEHLKGKKRTLLKMANRLYPVERWSLYKRGPFHLPEREVDCKGWHQKREGRL